MPTLVYAMVAFGWSWSLALIAYLLAGDRLLRAGSSGPMLLLSVGFMLGPMLGAVAGRQMLSSDERPGVLALRWRWNRWLLFAWLIALGLVVGASAISSLAPGIKVRSVAAGGRATVEALGGASQPTALPDGLLSALILVQAAGFGAVINMVLLLSEELGWRGFLWSRWRPLGFWRSAGLIGLVWGLWHAPIIMLGHNYPGMPVLGPVLMVGFCVLLTPIINHLRDRGGTVWHASLFHGTINATAGVGVLILDAPDWKWRGLVGLGGFIVMGIGTGLVAVARRGQPTE